MSRSVLEKLTTTLSTEGYVDINPTILPEIRILTLAVDQSSNVKIFATAETGVRLELQTIQTTLFFPPNF